MLEFGVADETAWKVGLSCGGTIRVFVEKLRVDVLHFVVAQGRGAITLLIIVLSMAVVMVPIEVMGWHVPDWQTYIAMAVLGAAGNAILVANTPSEDRIVIDKQTGKEFVLTERHTLFWIPIKYWTFIILGYAVVGTLRDYPK